LAARGKAKSDDFGTEQGFGKIDERERSLQEKAEGKSSTVVFCSGFDRLESAA
jgi:hypothetical protein